jgi:hypothetical protein
MVDYGIGGFYAERAREVNGPGYYDLKFGSEAVADPSQDGFGADRKDEGVKGGVFLNCNIASLTQNVQNVWLSRASSADKPTGKRQQVASNMRATCRRKMNTNI